MQPVPEVNLAASKMRETTERGTRLHARMLVILAIVCLTAPAVRAQLVTDYNPLRGQCCLPGVATRLSDALQDWNQLGRYYADDQELIKQAPNPKRVVFMGDSITDGWHLENSFADKPYVNRGISGQTTPQMLVRMYPDVIALKPAAVVIFAGTNDIARNTGPETLEQVEQNFMAMTELAQAHGIKVLLCSLTPISDNPEPAPGRMGPANGRGAAALPRVKQSEVRPPADILKLNAWLKDYAVKKNATYVDYYSAVADENGLFKRGWTYDGLHPNQEGYAAMSPVVSAALAKLGL
jgi:lysophospholipase L1-like esterase